MIDSSNILWWFAAVFILGFKLGRLERRANRIDDDKNLTRYLTKARWKTIEKGDTLVFKSGRKRKVIHIDGDLIEFLPIHKTAIRTNGTVPYLRTDIWNNVIEIIKKK